MDNPNAYKYLYYSKQQHVEAGQPLLQCLKNDGKEFFSHLVNGYDTYIFYMNAESKKIYMQWHHSSPVKVKNYKQTPSLWKIMGSFIKKSALMQLMEHGVTINTDECCYLELYFCMTTHNILTLFNQLFAVLRNCMEYFGVSPYSTDLMQVTKISCSLI